MASKLFLPNNCLFAGVVANHEGDDKFLEDWKKQRGVARYRLYAVKSIG